MSNTSASGGYLVPSVNPVYPDSLTFVQFIQTVMVGISGFDGKLVRPKWQPNPPKMPDIATDWLAFGFSNLNPDTFAFVGMDDSGVNHIQRNKRVEVQISVYGPNAFENTGLIQDGFQLTQNLEALQLAKMGLVQTTNALHAPELVNERFFDRYEFSVILNCNIQRSYPILSILSAEGKISTVLGNEDYLLDWSTQT